jgi:excisionase family DNA binding protein
MANIQVMKTAKVDGRTLYHITTAAEMCGVSKRTLERHIKAGKINAEKIGAGWYLSNSEIRKVKNDGRK